MKKLLKSQFVNIINQKRRVQNENFIYKSVPQLTVLKIADVFVTHGGMNSVSEALVYGTPMVVIPFVSDQPVNARCVEKLGVGKSVEYASVNTNTLKATVLSRLGDENMKCNLDKVQKMVKEAPGNQGGAKSIISYYENRLK